MLVRPHLNARKNTHRVIGAQVHAKLRYFYLFGRVNKEVFGELEYDAKSVTLETTPFQVSENTLVMMDEAVKNMKSGKVSEVIYLSVF